MPKQPATQHHMKAVESHLEADKRNHIAALHLEAGEHEKAKEHACPVKFPGTSSEAYRSTDHRYRPSQLTPPCPFPLPSMPFPSMVPSPECHESCT